MPHWSKSLDEVRGPAKEYPRGLVNVKRRQLGSEWALTEDSPRLTRAEPAGTGNAHNQLRAAKRLSRSHRWSTIGRQRRPSTKRFPPMKHLLPRLVLLTSFACLIDCTNNSQA